MDGITDCTANLQKKYITKKNANQISGAVQTVIEQKV